MTTHSRGVDDSGAAEAAVAVGAYSQGSVAGQLSLEAAAKADSTHDHAGMYDVEKADNHQPFSV